MTKHLCEHCLVRGIEKPAEWYATWSHGRPSDHAIVDGEELPKDGQFITFYCEKHLRMFRERYVPTA